MKNSKAQSLIEIVTLLAILVLVAVAMQPYIQRRLQGRIKDMSDIIIRTDPETKKVLPLKAYTSDSEKSRSKTVTDSAIKVTTTTGGVVRKDIKETTKVDSYSWSKNKPL